MTSPERTNFASTVELAHVHDNVRVPMTQTDVQEERMGERDTSEPVGQWTFFDCAACGTQVAIRFER